MLMMVKGHVLFLWVAAFFITTGANKHRSRNAERFQSSEHMFSKRSSDESTSTELNEESSLEKAVDEALDNLLKLMKKYTSMTENVPYSTFLKMYKTSFRVKKSHTEGFTTSDPTTPSTDVHAASTEGLKTVGNENRYSTAMPPVSATNSDSLRIGSIKGVPGVNFPDYTYIPMTSFSCLDKDYQPGFYADFETGCQVFHVCWPEKRESFLCPVGMIFNQSLLACDYWYSTNCSLSPYYYHVNVDVGKSEEPDDAAQKLSSTISVLLQKESLNSPIAQTEDISTTPKTMSFISQFLPIKAKTTIYPETKVKPNKVPSNDIGTGTMQVVQEKHQKPAVAPEQRTSTYVPSNNRYSYEEPTSAEVPEDLKNVWASTLLTEVIFDGTFAGIKYLFQVKLDNYMKYHRLYATDTPAEITFHLDVLPGFEELAAAFKNFFEGMGALGKRANAEAMKLRDALKISQTPTP